MIVRTGIVCSGNYKGWKIEVADDSEGATGGFYLILSSREKIFDYWFENARQLENQLTDFDVSWIIGSDGD
ncbi:hypothetical protein WG922_05280 [Ramlibacter sp. AN1015]|uniref:hypothetical protein n=1 Tax=Ramlibacter sp. AN1015 TaxID=3133428 RepID=UPI0030C0ACA0